jgi:hypothetical protein
MFSLTLGGKVPQVAEHWTVEHNVSDTRSVTDLRWASDWSYLFLRGPKQ